FVRLRQLEREVEEVHQELFAAEEAITATEETPQILARDVAELAQERGPALAQALLREEQAGIVALGDLPQRLDELQEQTNDLNRSVRERPPADMKQMDPQAQELVRLQQVAATLEEEINALRR